MHLGSDGQLEDMLFGQSLHLGTASVFVHRYRLPSLNICPFCGFTGPPQRNCPPTKKAVALSLIVVTLAFGLGFREASPNVSGCNVQSETGELCSPHLSLRDACLPFPYPSRSLLVSMLYSSHCGSLPVTTLRHPGVTHSQCRSD